MRLNISQKIMAMFAALIPLTILGLSVLGSFIEESRDHQGWVVHTYEVLNKSHVFLAHIVDAETGQRGFLLTGKKSYLQPFNMGEKAALNEIEQLKRLTLDNPEQQQRLVLIDQAIHNKFDEMKQTIELYNSGKAKEALALVTADGGKAIMDHIRLLLSQFSALEKSLLKQRTQEYEYDNAFSLSLLHWGAISIVIMMLGAGMLLARSISNPLRNVASGLGVLAEGKGDLTLRLDATGHDEIAELSKNMNSMMDMLSAMIRSIRHSSVQVTGSSNQIAASLREQEATVSEQAATTHEIAASSKEIAATATSLQHNMEGVVVLANEAAKSAGKGQKKIEMLEHALSGMHLASGSISSKLGNLSEKAANISQVATTISKVADQTNMLSLNASIEAEKAGEYGRGFSVVAQEIRHLADQTAAASIDIESIIRDMQASVSEGVMGMDKFSEEIRAGVETGTAVSEQLVEVINQVQELAPVVVSANESLRDQAEGAESISAAISELQFGAQQTSDMVSSTSHAVEDLHEAATDLQKQLGEFRVQKGSKRG